MLRNHQLEGTLHPFRNNKVLHEYLKQCPAIKNCMSKEAMSRSMKKSE
jgi:hypothetical protein